MSDKLFFRGTLILTFTGLASRIMGFFYRIFLSHTIGAQGVGIYQLTLPVHGIILAAAGMGIQAAISRLCASFTALEKEKESRNTLLLGMFLSGAVGRGVPECGFYCGGAFEGSKNCFFASHSLF